MSAPSPNAERPFNWAELLPDEDYRFHVGVKPGDAAAYFASTTNNASLLAQRTECLTHFPQRHAALLPEGEALMEETLSLAQKWGTPNHLKPISSANSPLSKCLSLGVVWEPDFLLLRPDSHGQPILAGGCVCFPSSWSLEAKIGHPVHFIHDVVPGLNDSLGDSINTFLTRLRPGAAWLRSNWGLSRSRQLNQHPDLKLPRLSAPITLENIWFRVENQLLTRLPDSGGILFAIRLEVISLAELVRDSSALTGLLRALKTMPETVAAYKSIATVRSDLIACLNTAKSRAEAGAKSA